MGRVTFRTDEQGASAIEYAIMVSLIAVVIIGAVILVGRQVQDDFECTYSAIYQAPEGCPGG